MEKCKISSLGLRIISSLVMVPLVVGAVYFGNPYLFLLLLLTGAMLCWEWSSMIKSANPALYATIYTVCMVISVLFPLSLLWLIIILFAGILAAYKARKEAHPVLLALGVPYIALGLGSIAWIYQVTDWVGIMWLILAVWSVDVGGYVGIDWRRCAGRCGLRVFLLLSRLAKCGVDCLDGGGHGAGVCRADRRFVRIGNQTAFGIERFQQSDSGAWRCF